MVMAGVTSTSNTIVSLIYKVSRIRADVFLVMNLSHVITEFSFSQLPFSTYSRSTIFRVTHFGYAHLYALSSLSIQFVANIREAQTIV